MRVAVHAEGSLDLGTAGGAAPHTALDPDALGAAHILVRRIANELGPPPFEALDFVGTLRDIHGRIPTGAALHREKTLRRLLSWPANRPDVVVVLVDEDGVGSRASDLARAASGLVPEPVLGVCVREFESWLAGDIPALSRILGRRVDQPPAAESASPGELKHWLRSLIGHDETNLRRRIATESELAQLVRQRSFERFAKDLRRAIERR